MPSKRSTPATALATEIRGRSGDVDPHDANRLASALNTRRCTVVADWGDCCAVTGNRDETLFSAALDSLARRGWTRIGDTAYREAA